MIQDSAMLVDLHISAWTGRKMDKKVSEEIDAEKNTQSRAGNYHKKLMAGAKRLEDLQKLVGMIRLWHYSQTLPWSDGGSRLLPMKNFFTYKEKLNEFERQFNEAQKEFVDDYPTLVTSAAFQLGDLFDRAEYPDASSLPNKFKFNYVFLPIPEMGDFRVDVNEAHKVELMEQYEKFYQTKLDSAMRDAWDRLHQVIKNISEKFAEEKPVFRDTLVGNALEICDLLTKLNVTQDPKLEQARKMLEMALVGVTPAELRKDEGNRVFLKEKVDQILGMF